MKHKRLNVSVILIVPVALLLIGVVVLAGVDSKMDTLYQQSVQQQKALRARALLQNIRAEIRQTNVQFQEIVDSGSFDTLDTELKTALQAGWNISKAAEAAFDADPNVVELLDWRK